MGVLSVFWVIFALVPQCVPDGPLRACVPGTDAGHVVRPLGRGQCVRHVTMAPIEWECRHHRDTEKASGEAVRAGGVSVAVESPATEKVLLSHEFDMRLSNYNQHKYHGEFEILLVVLSGC